MSTVKKAFHSLGCAATDVAKGAGKRARDIGPMKGLIGLAVVGAAVGGSIFLVRYIKARRAKNAEAPVSRASRKPMQAHATH